MEIRVEEILNSEDDQRLIVEDRRCARDLDVVKRDLGVGRRGGDVQHVAGEKSRDLGTGGERFEALKRERERATVILEERESRLTGLREGGVGRGEDSKSRGLKG